LVVKLLPELEIANWGLVGGDSPTIKQGLKLLSTFKKKGENIQKNRVKKNRTCHEPTVFGRRGDISCGFQSPHPVHLLGLRKKLSPINHL
jgi:hypothetical protein